MEIVFPSLLVFPTVKTSLCQEANKATYPIQTFSWEGDLKWETVNRTTVGSTLHNLLIPTLLTTASTFKTERGLLLSCYQILWPDDFTEYPLHPLFLRPLQITSTISSNIAGKPSKQYLYISDSSHSLRQKCRIRLSKFTLFHLLRGKRGEACLMWRKKKKVKIVLNLERTTCFVTKLRDWVHIIKVDDCILYWYIRLDIDWLVDCMNMEIGDIWVYKPIFCNNINFCRSPLYIIIFSRVYLTVCDLEFMQKMMEFGDRSICMYIWWKNKISCSIKCQKVGNVCNFLSYNNT